MPLLIFSLPVSGKQVVRKPVVYRLHGFLGLLEGSLEANGEQENSTERIWSSGPLVFKEVFLSRFIGIFMVMGTKMHPMHPTETHSKVHCTKQLSPRRSRRQRVTNRPEAKPAEPRAAEAEADLSQAHYGTPWSLGTPKHLLGKKKNDPKTCSPQGPGVFSDSQGSYGVKNYDYLSKGVLEGHWATNLLDPSSIWYSY